MQSCVMPCHTDKATDFTTIIRWSLYVLWLKYLSNFWPEDIGFIRTSIEDMELMEHRRSVARGHFSASSSSQSQQRPHHVFGYGQEGLYNTAVGPGAKSASSTHETIKILRAQVRELEMADDAGDVGQIRRRRRPRAATVPPEQGSSSSYSLDGDQGETQYSVSTPPGSSLTIDAQSSHVRHQLERQSPVSGEQQYEVPDPVSPSTDQAQYEGLPRLPTAFAGDERRRPPEPKYYVGEVFRHLLYRYTGVIYGYDLSKCHGTLYPMQLQ